MSALTHIKRKVIVLFKKNIDDHKAALSGAIGTGISFSPLFGFHYVLMFILNWFMDLNFPILAFTTSFNNPWTMVPMYAFDYSVGYWLIHSVFKVTTVFQFKIRQIYYIGPSLEKILGDGNICLWSFFVGGFVVATVAGIIAYPVFLYISRSVHKAVKIKNKWKKDEDHNG